MRDSVNAQFFKDECVRGTTQRVIAFFGSLLCIVFLVRCASRSVESGDVWITSPTDGSVVQGEVMIEVDVDPDDVVQEMELFIDDSLVRTFSSTPYIYWWDTMPLTDGSSHTLQAIVYSNVGDELVSLPITVTVDNSGC